MKAVRVALGQVNPTVGDLIGNAGLVQRFSLKAREANADLVVFPEMVLTGYPPEDLLLEPTFLVATEKTLQTLARQLPKDIAVVLGAPEKKGDRLYNTAVVIHHHRVQHRFRKWFLPNYGVFDEHRYFTPGTTPGVFRWKGIAIGLTVCEDVWKPQGPAPVAVKKGADLLVNLSASPYHAGKNDTRTHVLKQRVRECHVPFLYCNTVGGQDDLVYDGGSRVMDDRGHVLAQSPLFQEDLLVCDVPLKSTTPPVAPAVLPLTREDEILSALTLGTRDYVIKNGFKKIFIGLSGGIDSALTACIAVDALGKENVVGVTLPSRFNARETQQDAARLAKNLGIAFHSVPIEEIVRAFNKTLRPLFKGLSADVTEENLQSRVRGTLLMALANKHGGLVLTTGNKSEMSMGYFTLYGDSAGGFSVIKDIPKTLVYDLSRRVNTRAGFSLIPKDTLTRPPTAELRPNQKDQDTLPPYNVLDTIIQSYVEENKSFKEIVAEGLPSSLVQKTMNTMDAMEHKRRQAPLGIKITPRAFGRDRRMPITNRFRSDQQKKAPPPLKKGGQGGFALALVFAFSLTFPYLVSFPRV